MNHPFPTLPTAPTRILLALAPLALTLVACGTDASAEGPEPTAGPRAVSLAPVIQETLRRPVSTPGTFQHREEVALSFKIGGIVASVAVGEGDRVEAGQELASLELAEMDAAVSKATSAHEKAVRDLERLQRLYADSVATLAQLQDAETGEVVARADLETARFNRRYAVIYAPAPGIVLDRAGEAGELVSPGTAVLTLGTRDRGGIVQVALADRDLVRIRLGDPATATFDALPGRTFTGRVTEVGAAASPATGTYPVEITLDDAGALLAGMVGRVEIDTSGAVATTLVPVEAVLEADEDRATVFLLSPDGATALRRGVRIGSLHGDRIAVLEGLEDASEVLTHGAAFLTDGASVRVVR